MSFFSHPTATTEISTLSLHDALPISRHRRSDAGVGRARDPRRPAALDGGGADLRRRPGTGDRKSTRLNSSHTVISYAVFCLKKKIKNSMGRAVTPPGGIRERRRAGPP